MFLPRVFKVLVVLLEVLRDRFALHAPVAALDIAEGRVLSDVPRPVFCIGCAFKEGEVGFCWCNRHILSCLHYKEI